MIEDTKNKLVKIRIYKKHYAQYYKRQWHSMLAKQLKKNSTNIHPLINWGQPVCSPFTVTANIEILVLLFYIKTNKTCVSTAQKIVN